MKLKALISALCLASFSFSATATTELTQKAKVENIQQQKHDQARQLSFKQTEQDLQKTKAELEAKRLFLQESTDKLTAQFSENENRLARLEEQLRLETGSLGELFGVVRQNAKELQSELNQSVTGVDSNQYSAVIDDVVEAKSLPSMPQLTGLWRSMEEQIIASGQLSQSNIKFINSEGESSQVPAVRLGAIGLVTEQGYVDWNGQRQDAKVYLKQPESGPTLGSVSSLQNGSMSNLVVDPSRGTMLEQLAHTPSLMDRLSAGGVVGKVILGLLAVGLAIALFRGAVLVVARQKIRTQLKNPSKIGNNPLGRVLAVYDKEQNRSVEALELRLLEAVVDEQIVWIKVCRC